MKTTEEEESELERMAIELGKGWACPICHETGKIGYCPKSDFSYLCKGCGGISSLEEVTTYNVRKESKV